ncbi:xyloglucan-specific endo-beta-1,4-glucanase [Geosmithia morbida]|uniref:Xyloglucan-specific endo-beta-1,4-glucanase n=1 Tax=Geosmithia morbida TaxID=1094350 RepID=A0A9P4YZX3_9HYPO|nr:xyloglucan-specific endo-beta-1,4-glucanase [Geosmithia morbida]KAF4125140.1 xyloglucan-specific endo-beta-1,4-glucanase [Geosmithia morbida]
MLVLPVTVSIILERSIKHIQEDQFAYHGSHGYYFNNNQWGRDEGAGNQTLYVDRVEDTGVAWHVDWTWEGGENSVKSYPYSGREMPDEKRLVKDIGSIPTKVAWDYSGKNIRANVAYDLFTAADPNRDISGGDYELMIWLGNLGNVHPIGSNKGGVKVAGRTWALFVGNNGNMKVYSFVAPDTVKSFDANLMPFFDYITNHYDFPAGDQYLTTLQFGTEPFTGSNATFTTSNWEGHISNEAGEDYDDDDDGACCSACVVV